MAGFELSTEGLSREHDTTPLPSHLLGGCLPLPASPHA